MLSKIISVAAAATLLVDGAAAFSGPGRFSEMERRPMNRARDIVEEAHAVKPRATNETYRYYGPATEEYFVESLPDFNFDLGELYSGLMPIDANNASRALFFAFQPTIGDPVDEVTIWFNGGPGCSSLEGFLQENGRWTWAPGTYLPVENEYSWVNLTNMLWVEYPVGTGFSVGEIFAESQEQTAQDFVGFFKNFQKTFGISNYKIYVTGESYAGRYVPYVSAAMLDQNDTEYYDLSGMIVYDPCIGQFDSVQEEIPIVPYVIENNNFFAFNDSFISDLQNLHESCGYKDFIDQYLVFPASGIQPVMTINWTSIGECDLFDLVSQAALEINPCFDIYEINQQCPLLWDVLAFPTALQYSPEGATVYFNRTDVKTAIHAPQYVDWLICGENSVFIGDNGRGGPESEGDLSANPIEHVLPQVIEATNRVLVSNGDLDMILLNDGALLSIQNMTWNGKLGFEEKPDTPIVITLPDLQWAEAFEENGEAGVDNPQGDMGIQHYERGLMWAETKLSGHMQPEFQPRVTYRHLEWVLGRIDVL